MPSLKPIKPHKTFKEQLAILAERGLIIDDERKALGYLQTVGYYRLSGYLYIFRKPSANRERLDEFYHDCHFNDVIRLYMFDKKLRHLALVALERIEVAMRVQIVHNLGAYDPLAHLDAQYFDSEFDHATWKSNYETMVSREKRKSDFVKHNIQVYGDLPIWAGCEVWDFGTMSKLYQGMKPADKDKIAHYYNLAGAKQLETQLIAFNFIRNVSAHYGRLWNRYVALQASTKGMEKTWRQFPKNRVCIYFCLMARILNHICPNSRWKERFIETLEQFPETGVTEVNLHQFGLPIPLSELKEWLEQ